MRHAYYFNIQCNKVKVIVTLFLYCSVILTYILYYFMD